MQNSADVTSIQVRKHTSKIADENKSISCSLIIHDFCLNTSAHALPDVARSTSLHSRIFWLTAFIAFTGIMVYFVVKAILAYFDYPTSMDISFVDEWPQYFPAVSICNASPFRLDLFIQSFFNYTTANNLTTGNASTITEAHTSTIRKFLLDSLNRNISMEPFFFSLSSILYDCTFNNIPCSASNFIPFISSAYAACYTFNAKLKNASQKSIFTANKYGGDGKLALSLFIHSHQYVPYLKNEFGAIGLVHDNTELPLIETRGIELTPGSKHKIGYRKKTIYFLSPPYTQCSEYVSPTMHAMFNYYNGADYQYSEAICYQICGQTYSYEQCGCVSPYLWSGRSIVLPGTNKMIIAPICDSANECYKKAIEDLTQSSVLINKYCSDCSSQCSKAVFVVEKSSLKAPAEWQMNDIKAFVEKSRVPLPVDWSTKWRKHIYRSYVAVSVVREAHIVENVTQSASLSSVDVLSNVGGQTGLWIGVSFLSLLEFVAMFYRLIRYQYHSCRSFCTINREPIHLSK